MKDAATRSSRTAIRRTLLAALVVVGVVGAASAPASAATQNPVFPGALGTVAFNVNGTYTPLPLVCGPDLDIFWYAPGRAADFIWSGIDPSGPSLTYSTRPTSVNGVYRPMVGDFDGDQCDDIFWYAPGGAADYVWYNDGGSNFTSREVRVNGSYRPVVNFFNEDNTDDIYWYAPGRAAEAMWTGNTNRTMSSTSAPQVNGVYSPAPFFAGGVLWYGPGGAPDVVTAVTAGRTVADVSIPTRIFTNFQAIPMFVTPLLYAPGPVGDFVASDLEDNGDGTATLLGAFGSINGSYRVGTTSSAQIAVLHAPGPASDQLLFSLPDIAAAGEGAGLGTLRRERPSISDALDSAGGDVLEALRG